jgi:dephospho-CoA kinase
MIKIGITGGIGSGKSTACKVFAVLGIPVFEADKVARHLMNFDTVVSEQLIQAFGESVYLPDHTINRKYLAELVFNSKSLLAGLNSIVHPAVRKAFFEWLEQQSALYAIHEAAILFESGFYKMMDKTITVATDEDQRIQRVVKRDGISVEQVRERIRNQWNDEERIKLANFVIKNNDADLIIPQILEIDKKIRAYG